MNEIHIRQAQEEDAARLYGLASRVFYNTFAPDNTAEDMLLYMESAFSPERQRQEILDPQRITLVAFTDETLVGYVQFTEGLPEPCVTTAKPIELARLYVDETWHGKGLASRLLQEGLTRVQNRGFQTVWLGVWEHNPRAQKFYLKSGFKRVGEHIFQMGTDPQTDWVLSIQLTD